MRIPRTLFSAAALSISLLSATGAQAALQTRLGGLAIYDTDLNLTWLANANVNGPINWREASAWVSGLRVGGISGWRLPSTCAQFGGTNYNCTGTEMNHLFYNELGGVAGQPITTTHNANYSLFQNLQGVRYWSNTNYATDPSLAWYFNFSNGRESAEIKSWGRDLGFYALAVFPGDVATVPVPGAAWLLGSGLLALIGVARRQR